MPKKLTTNEFLLRLSRRDDGGLFYDYSLVEYTSCLNKIKIVCPVHGAFMQNPANHKNSNDGCYTCGRVSVSAKSHEKYSTERYLTLISTARKDKALYYDYSHVIYAGKNHDITIICPKHGYFRLNAEYHKYNCGCQQCEHDNRIKTNLLVLGVDNPSKSEIIKARKKVTLAKNYGVDHPMESLIIREKQSKTVNEHYGVDYPMQSKIIRDKAIATKINNGTYYGFASKEATVFFRDYIVKQGYDITQVRYNDLDAGTKEWGYNIGKWILYDFVAFERGFVGDKNHIIEIVEYHGPWHYTKEDAELRGHEKATPFVKNKVTIAESYKNDMDKFNFAKSLTDSVTIIWAKDL